MTQQRIPGTIETITIGPVPVFFCNTNTAMALKSHCHQADVNIGYETTGLFGYPSFEATNNAIRARLKARTGVGKPFRDSTNEDVLRTLWGLFDGWVAPEWESWGGDFRLHTMTLDVHASADAIGHDPGTTRYTIRRVDSEAS